MYQAGYRNSDTSSNPYNNNTGQVDQVEVTNYAYGFSLTMDAKITEDANLRLLASDGSSNYEAGLDDDSFFDDFLSFPEEGEANQQSVELHLTGTPGAIDYVVGLYWYEEKGHNFQDDTTFKGGPGGDFFLAEDHQQGGVCQCRLPGQRRVAPRRRRPLHGRPSGSGSR